MYYLAAQQEGRIRAQNIAEVCVNLASKNKFECLCAPGIMEEVFAHRRTLSAF